MKKISERMVELRQGMTQLDAGKRIGKNQQTWARYESDAVEPNAAMIRQICSAFSVSADWLLGLTDDRAPGAAVTTDARIAELEKKVIRLEGENSALQKALEIVGGRPARSVKTGGAPAAKIA